MFPFEPRDLNDFKKHLRYLRFKQNLRNFFCNFPIIGRRLAFTLAPQTRLVSNTELSVLPLVFRNHIIIISTIPFALSLMLISTPVMIQSVINVVPFALWLGAAGLWLARRRGIRVENRFLALMLTSFGISTAFIAPMIAADVFSNSLPPLLSVSFLYGVTLAIFLMLSFGLYGMVVNFKKPLGLVAGG